MNDVTTLNEDDPLARAKEARTALDAELRRVREHITTLTRQRDELAACLREVREACTAGNLMPPPDNCDLRWYASLLVRIDAALLRLDVRERLDDKLQAERKETT